MRHPRACPPYCWRLIRPRNLCLCWRRRHQWTWTPYWRRLRHSMNQCNHWRRRHAITCHTHCWRSKRSRKKCPCWNAFYPRSIETSQLCSKQTTSSSANHTFFQLSIDRWWHSLPQRCTDLQPLSVLQGYLNIGVDGKEEEEEEEEERHRNHRL